MSDIKEFFGIKQLFGDNRGRVAVRIHADNFRDTCYMLHEMGWVFASGNSLLSTHVDDGYRRDEERGSKPHIILDNDGYVGRTTAGYRLCMEPNRVYEFDDIVSAYHRILFPIEVSALDLASIYIL